jgi:hypothetical protein
MTDTEGATVLGPIGTLVDHAVAYTRLDLEIFPVNPADKTPLVSQYTATTDTDTVTAWWQRWPDALIGHHISPHHLILDIDPRHGGLDTWTALKAELSNPRFLTRVHYSGRYDNGGHIWFQRPADKVTITKLDAWARERGVGQEIPQSRRWSCGIDILRAEHRYTILPPSLHPETRRPYYWGGGRGIDTDPAPMPQLLVDLLVLDESPPPRESRPHDPDSIADWYSDQASWTELLTDHGWILVGGDGDSDGSRWRHPTATGAHSATITHGCLFVYSPNTPFDVTYPSEPHGYTPFRAYATLEHSGDLQTAGKIVRAKKVEKSAIKVTEITSDDGLNSLNSLNSPTDTQEWPQLHPDALHGPVGEAVYLLDPHTEADPAAVLATLLTGWGATLNKGPHALAGHATHPARLSVVIVGETSKARKGTSWATARILLEHIDPDFMLTKVIGGFGSGESVVDEVRDPQPSDDPNKTDDPGVTDKRLLIHEPEFARVLKVCSRESSILSAVIRDAWDGSRLQARARTRRAVATGHHIAMVGHITAPELRRNLTETEIAGGFANRILWICARRSKFLPFHTSLNAIQLKNIGMVLREARAEALKTSLLEFTPEARDHWEQLYYQMADDDPGGLLGAIVARPEPQCLRLALIYALLDQSKGISPAHIDAAWALWSYSRTSAQYIWGDAVGDEIADSLHRAIRRAGQDGLDFTAQSAEFSRRVTAKRLATARAELETQGLIETIQEDTGGRPRMISRVLAKKAK